MEQFLEAVLQEALLANACSSGEELNLKKKSFDEALFLFKLIHTNQISRIRNIPFRVFIRYDCCISVGLYYRLMSTLLLLKWLRPVLYHLNRNGEETGLK